MIIELSNFNGGGQVFLNSNYIVSISPDVGEGTVITMRQGFHRVRETASEIAAIVNEYHAPIAELAVAEEAAEVVETAPKAVGRPVKKTPNDKKTD